MDDKREAREWEEMYKELKDRLIMLQVKVEVELEMLKKTIKYKVGLAGRYERRLTRKRNAIIKAIAEQPSVQIPQWMYDEMGYPGL